jgi:murein tripeptide amidase MpaA
LLGSLAFMAGILAGSSPTEASIKTSQDIQLQAENTDRLGVRVYYTSLDNLDAIASSLDIWENHRQEGYILASVYPAQRDWLEASGYRVEVDEETTTLLQSPQAALDPRYYYFDDEYFNSYGRYVVDFLQNTQTLYPNLTELFDIGNAWQGNNGGYLRDMWVLRITSEDPAYGAIEDKPVFFIMAEIHAREVTTPELAVRYVKYLTSGYLDFGGYDIDADVTWLVNHNAVYVLVMQNPDGYRINEQEISNYRRKNMDNDDGCSSPSTWGVDLNRNHSFLWGCCGGSSGDPCDPTFRGVFRASEPETSAFQDYIQTLIPDQNGPNGDDVIGETAPLTTTGIFVSLHSYSDEILWPWFLPGYPDSPNQQQMEDIGRKMSAIDTHYSPAGTVGYTVDGSANYWVYGKLGIPAYTFETGPQFGSCGNFFTIRLPGWHRRHAAATSGLRTARFSSTYKLANALRDCLWSGCSEPGSNSLLRDPGRTADLRPDHRRPLRNRPALPNHRGWVFHRRPG